MTVLTLHAGTDVPTQPSGTHYRVPADKLISGDPEQTVWVEYADVSGQFCVGVWQSAVGKWRVAYTEDEVCVMLDGVSVLTDEATGRSATFTAGDRFVVPRGFKGTWEVVSPTRKTFVIYEPRGAQDSATGVAASS